MGILIMFLIFALVLLAIIGLAGVSYALTSYGFYSIAKNRGLKNPWLAWIPVASYWTIGSIASDCDREKGIDRKWHKVLIILGAVVIGTYVALYVFMIVFTIAMAVMNYNYGVEFDEMFGFVVALDVIIILMALVAVAFSACLSICVFKIFESAVPEKALKYFMMYLLVPIAGPICVFKCRYAGVKPEAECVCIEAPSEEPAEAVFEEISEESENTVETENIE